MKSIHNVVSDVLDHFGGRLTARIIEDPNVANRWRIEVRHIQAPEALLEVEVLALGDDEWVGAVLQKVNVGRRSMTRFMDRLMESLD